MNPFLLVWHFMGKWYQPSQNKNCLAEYYSPVDIIFQRTVIFECQFLIFLEELWRVVQKCQIYIVYKDRANFGKETAGVSPCRRPWYTENHLDCFRFTTAVLTACVWQFLNQRSYFASDTKFEKFKYKPISPHSIKSVTSI